MANRRAGSARLQPIALLLTKTSPMSYTPRMRGGVACSPAQSTSLPKAYARQRMPVVPDSRETFFVTYARCYLAIASHIRREVIQ